MHRRSRRGTIGWAAVLTFGSVTLMSMVAGPRVAAQAPVVDTSRIGGTFALTRDAIFSGLANQIGSLPYPTGGSFT